MKTFFIVLTLVFIDCLLLLEAQVPNAVTRRIEEQEVVANQLADRVAELFRRRQYYLSRCVCSSHSCTNDVTSFECSTKLGSLSNICGDECPGRQIDYNKSSIRTPPNTEINNLDNRLKESICLYSNLEPLMMELISPQNPNWLYFGGVDGSFRIYPSAARNRGLENSDDLLGGCRQYDPRIRPWFIGASTRPKDIVFVIDMSGSMEDPAGYLRSESRWDVTRRAILAMLDTLASFDYVNVVTFANKANRLYRTSARSLLQGTDKNLRSLKSKVTNQFPDGATNFAAGFSEAFDILETACRGGERETCSGCQKVILFLTDGRDTTGPDEESIEASDMLAKIERHQQSLEDSGSQRARIFTFSMGEAADDSIPRQIACANNGSWSYIGPGTDPLTALNGYYHFLTGAGSSSTPVWVNPYEDDGGLGLITTVAKPVYSEGTQDVEGVFLGVVGHDVLLSELERPGVSHQQVLGELTRRSYRCSLSPQTPCQLQVHRNAFAADAVCVDPVLNFRGSNDPVSRTGEEYVYRHGRKYYKIFLDKVSWRKAEQSCEANDGRLVTISNDRELEFVAGLSSPDGSWIGATRDLTSQEMKWIDQRVSSANLELGSDS